jgi:TolB-like protein
MSETTAAIGSGGGDSPAAARPPPPVFVSHASADAALAERVCAALEAHGVRCWIAPRDVVPGEFYADAIVRAIDGSRALVLVLTAHAAASHHVLREVERAGSKRHPILTLRIDRAPMPAALEYFLNTAQRLETSAADAGAALPRLVSACEQLLASPPGGPAYVGVGGAPTPAPAQAGSRRARLALGATLIAAAAVVAFVRLRSPHPVAATPPASAAPAAAPAAPRAPEKSVAVMAFDDLSEKRNQEYFADGLAEELLNLLAQVPELRVPARSSSFYYKGKDARVATIARELGVAHLLEGSVRRVGNTVRVSVELVRADTGYHVWSHTYDRDVRDIFKVQDEISAAVVGALKAQLTTSAAQLAERRSASPQAYDQFLLGVHFYRLATLADWRRAATAFARSMRADPGFAPAYAALAMVEYRMDAEYADHPDPAAARRALGHADRAVALGPDLADAYSTRAFLRMNARWDWAGARADLDRALALDPADSNVERRLGLLDMALGESAPYLAAEQRAADLDPVNLQSVEALGEALLAAGKPAAAREAFERARALSPAYDHGNELVGVSFLAEGQPAAAKRECARGEESGVRECLAIAEFRLGERDAARAVIADVAAKFGSSDPVGIADVYAACGEADRAFEWLGRALAMRSPGLASLKLDPFLAPLRADPRYAALLAEMGLPP